MRQVKNLGVITIVCILLLAILEVGTRYAAQRNTVFGINIGSEKEYHPVRKTQLRKGYSTGSWSINSFGLLGPEFNLEPDPGSVRILTMGDSVTFSPANRNYSAVLRDKLREYFPTEDIEVLVGAVSGYDSFSLLHWNEEFLHKLTPDIAIIYIGWNDIGQYSPFGLNYKNAKLTYQNRTIFSTLLEKIYLLRAPYYFIGRMERAKSVDKSPLTEEEKQLIDNFEPYHYFDNLKNLIQQLNEQGAEVYILNLASRVTHTPSEKEIDKLYFARGMKRKLAIYEGVYNKYQMALDQVAATTQTQVIDIQESIIDEQTRDSIFTDMMHINEKGAELYGIKIAESIKIGVSEILKTKVGG